MRFVSSFQCSRLIGQLNHSLLILVCSFFFWVKKMKGGVEVSSCKHFMCEERSVSDLGKSELVLDGVGT